MSEELSVARNRRIRPVIISVETILELMKDYLGEENIPQDAKVVALQMMPSEKGRLAIVAESESWGQAETDLVVAFDLKRTYASA